MPGTFSFIFFFISFLFSFEFLNLFHSFVFQSYCPYHSGRCDIMLDLPSKRYITLLREGAKHWGLHPKYCEYLENYPHADYPKWIKYPFVVGILIPVLGPFFCMIFCCRMMDKILGGTIFKRSFPYLMLYYFRPAMKIVWNTLDILTHSWNYIKLSAANFLR